MISIKGADKFQLCRCCMSDNNVVELAFASDRLKQSSTVALCENCAKELMEKLNALYKEDAR